MCRISQFPTPFFMSETCDISHVDPLHRGISRQFGINYRASSYRETPLSNLISDTDCLTEYSLSTGNTSVRLDGSPTWTDTYAGAKGCRAVAAAAAASGPGFLASARAAALVGKVALVAPTRPRCMATPLSAAAATTHTRHARTCTIIEGRLPWRLTLRYRPLQRGLQVAPRGTAAHIDSRRDEVRGLI